MTLFLPTVAYLKGTCTEDSEIKSLSCVGPYYAEQIKRICGRHTLGRFLEYCSDRDRPELVRVLQSCSRNQRAGEPNQEGRAIPDVNVRVLASLLQLLALGRKSPQLFPNYKVNIIVTSKELNDLLQNLMS
jgi:hypothetical protein